MCFERFFYVISMLENFKNGGTILYIYGLKSYNRLATYSIFSIIFYNEFQNQLKVIFLKFDLTKHIGSTKNLAPRNLGSPKVHLL